TNPGRLRHDVESRPLPGPGCARAALRPPCTRGGSLSPDGPPAALRVARWFRAAPNAPDNDRSWPRPLRTRTATGGLRLRGGKRNPAKIAARGLRFALARSRRHWRTLHAGRLAEKIAVGHDLHGGRLVGDPGAHHGPERCHAERIDNRPRD